MKQKEKPLMYKGQEIVSWTYKGTNAMLGKSYSGDTKTPTRVPKDFEAKLRLKDGSIVDAPPEWRKKIWSWWFQSRWDEIGTSVLTQICDDMLGRNR